MRLQFRYCTVATRAAEPKRGLGQSPSRGPGREAPAGFGAEPRGKFTSKALHTSEWNTSRCIARSIRAAAHRSLRSIMPLVRVRILLGKAPVAAPLRPFPADATIEHVVSQALEPYSDCTCVSLDIFPTRRQ